MRYALVLAVLLLVAAPVAAEDVNELLERIEALEERLDRLESMIAADPVLVTRMDRQEIGKELYVQNVSTRSGRIGGTVVLAEVINDSDTDYEAVRVAVSLFDMDDRLIGTDWMPVENVPSGGARGFEITFRDVDEGNVDAWRWELQSTR